MIFWRLICRCTMSFTAICFLFMGTLYADGTCESDVCLSFDGSNLNYESTVDISGFQFNHDGCASDANGGDAVANGFLVQGSESVILAFSFTGSSIPAGSGTLVEGVNCDTIDGLVFSGAGGSTLTAELVEGDDAVSYTHLRAHETAS